MSSHWNPWSLCLTANLRFLVKWFVLIQSPRIFTRPIVIHWHEYENWKPPCMTGFLQRYGDHEHTEDVLISHWLTCHLHPCDISVLWKCAWLYPFLLRCFLSPWDTLHPNRQASTPAIVLEKFFFQCIKLSLPFRPYVLCTSREISLCWMHKRGNKKNTWPVGICSAIVWQDFK